MPESNDNKQNTKQHSELLKNNNWLYDALLSKEDGVIATDKKGEITSMNKVAEELTGWSLSESIGNSINSIFDAINENTGCPIENPINKALKENKPTLLANHTILIKKDKTQRIIVDSATPLYNVKGEIIGGALIFRDVTEQSFSKKRLDKSVSTLDGILQNTDSIIYIKDMEGKYLLFNKKAEKVYNIKESDLLGKKTIENITWELSEETRRTDLNAIINSRLVETEEEIKHQDGDLHSYHAVKFPLFDSDEKVYAIGAILTDISERKIINELKAQLSALAMEKGSDRESLVLVDRLKKEYSDLKRYAYTVSHDLRAPIARVLGLVTVSQIDPNFKINDKTILENVASELTALDNVVKDMNATIAVKDKEKYKEYITFDTELRLLKKVLDNEIKNSNAAITADFSSNLGVITVKSYLYSIMYNLLLNAIKYRLPDVPLTIHLKSRQENDFVCLTIKDNGMGIDLKKNGDKVFGLYNRFHDKKIDGKGIGLNLVKVQVEALGGNVELESKVNQGCTFNVFFPINPKAIDSINTNTTATSAVANKPGDNIESKDDIERLQQTIEYHQSAAYHLGIAAKFNLEAVVLHQSGKHKEGEESAIIAQGHYMLAGKYQTQTESAYLFNW